MSQGVKFALHQSRKGMQLSNFPWYKRGIRSSSVIFQNFHYGTSRHAVVGKLF